MLSLKQAEAFKPSGQDSSVCQQVRPACFHHENFPCARIGKQIIKASHMIVCTITHSFQHMPSERHSRCPFLNCLCHEFKERACLPADCDVSSCSEPFP